MLKSRAQMNFRSLVMCACLSLVACGGGGGNETGGGSGSSGGGSGSTGGGSATGGGAGHSGGGTASTGGGTASTGGGAGATGGGSAATGGGSGVTGGGTASTGGGTASTGGGAGATGGGTATTGGGTASTGGGSAATGGGSGATGGGTATTGGGTGATGGGTGSTAPTIAKVSAGRIHTCAMTTAGGLWCWGSAASGALGNNVTDGSSAGNFPTPVQIFTANVVDVGVGHDHSCVVFGDGGVSCWGANESGQLGLGSTTPYDTPQHVTIASFVATKVSGGQTSTCALSNGGAVKCWGSDQAGQLGNTAVDTDSATPIDVVGLNTGVTSLSVGATHACVVQNGTLECWGSTSYGEMGITNPPTGAVETPGAVAGPLSGVGVVAGYNTSCGWSASNLWCWGNNATGECGNGNMGTQVQENTPSPVSTITSGVTSVSANSGSYHAVTCAVVSGALKCWGDNYNYAVGTGHTPGNVTDLGPFATPQAVPNMTSGVTQVSVGAYHACAVQSGVVKCWGAGSPAIGNGDSELDQPTPGPVIFP